MRPRNAEDGGNMKTYCVLFAVLATQCFTAEIIKLEKTIPLPKVEGRIDHLAVDLKMNRVFIAALGNNTVEIVDLTKGERIHTISGLEEPQGVAFVPETNQIVVACGGDGSCRFYDGASYKLIKTVDLKGDADNVRYDAAAKRLYVGHVSGALATIDAANATLISEAKLSAHPEAFVAEKSGDRIFVNVPNSKKIEVVDRRKNEVIAKWSLKGARSNFPMTLDEAGNRLFAGCRGPAKILVLDTESGKETVAFDCPGDVDDIFFDSKAKRLYAIGGEGKLNIFTQVDADHYKLEAEIKTSSGARTGLFVPELSTIFVAVPHKNNDQAELRCYRVQ
jgi:DNA-binding beta-propeller fold protein YncE